MSDNVRTIGTRQTVERLGFSQRKFPGAVGLRKRELDREHKVVKEEIILWTQGDYNV